jgi:hypothetical protein
MRTRASAKRMLAAAAALTAALTGCARGGAGVTNAADACPVTSPGGRVPASGGDFNHGNGSLAVALWPKGRLVAGRLPDGSSYAEIRPDGAVAAKLGWSHAVEGELSVEGERLDAPAPPLLAEIPNGYGHTGFQPTGLTFPTEGCWKVRGSVARTRLTFVVLVSKPRERKAEQHAAERSRTSTPVTEHRHLKPARLPVPPQPRGR